MKKYIVSFKLTNYFGQEIIFAENEILAWSQFEKMLINEGFATFECGCCIDWRYIFGSENPIIIER